MSQTLYGNQLGSETLRAGKVLTISVDAGGGAIVEQFNDGRKIAGSDITASTAFGPFVDDTVLKVSAKAGATVTIGDPVDQVAQRPTDSKAAAVDSLVSEDGTVPALVSLSKDADQGVNFGTDEIILSAAGSFLLRASQCRLVKVRCLSGTADITLRNGITNSVTAANTTSRILWKGTGIVAGSEPYVPRGDNGAGILVTEGLHLTLAGTSPVVAVYIR